MDAWILAVVGDAGVGKTSVVDKLVNNCYVETYSYRLANVDEEARRQLVVDNKMCFVEILQYSLKPVPVHGVIERGHTPPHPAGRVDCVQKKLVEADAYILTYSITSRKSYSRVLDVHQDVLDQVAASADENSKKPFPRVLMLVGNKCDRGYGYEREVSKGEGGTLARKLNCAFYETSGTTAKNVEKMFMDVIRELRKSKLAAERISPVKEARSTDKRSTGKIQRKIKETMQKSECIVM
ncbi:P-loop containing nucleoside triphosphate hydrolase protein [Agrocybe pediades]|nr:P-loop containing nucleoside triphosphate hydrolase protein [Agrocybe pediades]